MNKTALLRVVNAALFISFVVQAWSAISMLLHVKFPPMHTIAEIHEHNGLIFIALVLIHLTLNWGWVRANIFKR